jgi:hypothetical protein
MEMRGAKLGKALEAEKGRKAVAPHTQIYLVVNKSTLIHMNLEHKL